MTAWLETDEAPIGFTVDHDTELRATGESRAAVRYVKHALEVDVVGIDDAGTRIFHGPDHAAHHTRRDLDARRVVIRRELARCVNRNARAEPVRAAAVAHEERSELVLAVVDLIHENAPLLLPDPAFARELVY